MKCIKDDFRCGAVLPRFSADGKIPFRYKLDGREYSGIPAEFGPGAVTRRIDSSVVFSVVTGRTPEGLELRAECREYLDYPVTEWVMYMTNAGSVNSAVISDWCATASLPVCALKRDGGARPPVLLHGNGDNISESGYSWFADEIGSRPLSVSPCGDGTSCNGAFPYMRFLLGDYSVNAAVGWTGTWQLSASLSSAGGTDVVNVEVRQQRFNTYLEPGETVRTPLLILQTASGSEDRARNLWRSWYIDHILPRENGKPLSPKLVLHTWMIDGLPEFCGTTEENQLKGIQTYIDHGLKPDIWWIDAGWYPCNNDWPTGTGNWYPNPEHFPDGFHKIGEMCDDNDIDFLVWFEPERIFRNTEVWNEHPDFLIFGSEEDNNALFFLGDPAAREWLTDRIDSIIKEGHIRIYRQDFNFPPSGYWAKGEAENRAGIHENLHIQGYYAFWDELIRRNPGLLIDSCSSGGRRNDIETMKRAVPLHYTDIGYGNHPIKQKQHRQMFEWIPYFRAHTMNWDKPDGTYGGSRPVDEFAYQNALAPSVTSMIEWNDPDELNEVGRRFHPVWRKAAEMMLRCDYYPLTETRVDAGDWYAMQFHDEDANDGFVQLIRNVRVNDSRFTVRGFVPDENLDRIYRFFDPFTNRVWTMSGRNFRSGGFEDALEPRSGVIWFYSVI
ncbi:MAG: alpha-galactosidase [Clostridia bacterium]|nr:alpha-galactosidase [Clostridia bacterium]